jgi:hypothetical protein
LDRIANGIESISAVMGKLESRMKKGMELAGLIVIILGLVHVADIIKNWIIGG